MPSLILISYYFLTLIDGPIIGKSFLFLQKNWLKLPKTKLTFLNFNIFKPKIKKQLLLLKQQMIVFLKRVRGNKSLRGDYLECVDLSLILCGEELEGYFFKAPQGLSKARWMCRILYAMKELLFEQELNHDPDYLKQLNIFCIFVILFYLKPWLRAGFPAEAALLDLEFVQNLKHFEKIDSEASKAVLEKVSRHTWYMSGELVGLSLFSDNLMPDQKIAIVNKIKSTKPDWSERSIKSSYDRLDDKRLEDFVDSTTGLAIEGLGIDLKSFIHLHPKAWPQNQAYIDGQDIVNHLGVINDAAERKVKLMSEFNDFATKSEGTKQQIVKNAEYVRQQYPNFNKTTLSKPLFS